MMSGLLAKLPTDSYG